MKKFGLFIIALVACLFVGCDNSEDSVEFATPTILLEKVDATSTTLSFNATVTEAEEAAYMVVADGESLPTLDEILTNGVKIQLTGANPLNITATGLTPSTSYQVVAAAKNAQKSAGSNTLYMQTAEQGVVSVSAEIVQLDHEKMNFRISTENAEKVAYLVLYSSKEAPTAEYCLLNGEEIAADTREAVEVTNLECSKEYTLYVAAEGIGQKVMAEPKNFTTDDDPENVITHSYTRAKGSKYGSNYFIMLSYEDANEEDNFAYNEKTLSLDFYGDPEKDYLPAGTYEVTESTEYPCISSFRYSNYGYDNGVKLKSGQAVVTIDPETKAYSFDVNISLIDGRKLKATYNGDIDNMPVIDKVFIEEDYTSAKATTADEGLTWNLKLTDPSGNEASINLTNAYQANYIVNSAYTISSSEEEFSAKTLAAEAGEFDSETSTFKVAGEGEFKFATGTLTVDIDWENKKYLVSLNGTLENDYIIQAEYTGVIEGCSLEQSTEIIEIVMDTARARSYDNTNWYIIFSKGDTENPSHRMVLDAYCSASDYLPAGVYKLGVGSGPDGYISESTNLTIAGETQYTFVEATATVTTDMDTKTYLFDITAKVVDGRTYKVSYTGTVEGMEITEPKETPTEIEWTSFAARHWYLDNWELSFSDTNNEYKVALDMHVGDSSLSYIPSGTYTIAEEGKYIDDYYSTLNGNKSAFSEAELVVVYDETTKLYDLSFNLTLSNGNTLTGKYNGAITGTPKE